VGLKHKIMDKKLLHGQLMNEHRLITNEISDIKAANFELTKDQKERVSQLESRLKMIAHKLYHLYK